MGYSAFSQTVGEGDLLFYVNNGTILTPVVVVDGTDYGFHNLAGEPINADGTPRTYVTSPGVTAAEIEAAITAQYTSTNGNIVIITP